MAGEADVLTPERGALDALEHYVREAKIEMICPLDGGGGHPAKMTLVLSGGVGVVGKPANDERTKVQADREVAARILAVELGLDSLVPVTVLRNMPPQADVDGETVGSAQVLWPGFKTALEAKLKASQCPGGEATSWPIALFDWLASNSDRHLANWGVIKMFDGSFRVVLIDHGHAFGGGGHGEFAEHHQGQELPPALLAQVEAFVSGQDQSRLYGVLSDEDVAHVYERASAVATEKQLILR